MVLVYWCAVYDPLCGCIFFGPSLLVRCRWSALWLYNIWHVWSLIHYVLYVTSFVFISCFHLVYFCVVYYVLYGYKYLACFVLVQLCADVMSFVFASLVLVYWYVVNNALYGWMFCMFGPHFNMCCLYLPLFLCFVWSLFTGVLYVTSFLFVYCLVLVYWCVVYNALYGCILFGMFGPCFILFSLWRPLSLYLVWS